MVCLGVLGVASAQNAYPDPARLEQSIPGVGQVSIEAVCDASGPAVRCWDGEGEPLPDLGPRVQERFSFMPALRRYGAVNRYLLIRSPRADLRQPGAPVIASIRAPGEENAGGLPTRVPFDRDETTESWLHWTVVDEHRLASPHFEPGAVEVLIQPEGMVGSVVRLAGGEVWRCGELTMGIGMPFEPQTPQDGIGWGGPERNWVFPLQMTPLLAAPTFDLCDASGKSVPWVDEQGMVSAQAPPEPFSGIDRRWVSLVWDTGEAKLGVFAEPTQELFVRVTGGGIRYFIGGYALEPIDRAVRLEHHASGNG